MVDDIVTRLREKYAGQLPICNEAADEIERLRALLVHGLIEGYYCKGCDLCKQLKAIYNQAILDAVLPANDRFTSFIHPEGREDGI